MKCKNILRVNYLYIFSPPPRPPTYSLRSPNATQLAPSTKAGFRNKEKYFSHKIMPTRRDSRKNKPSKKEGARSSKSKERKRIHTEAMKSKEKKTKRRKAGNAKRGSEKQGRATQARKNNNKHSKYRTKKQT